VLKGAMPFYPFLFLTHFFLHFYSKNIHEGLDITKLLMLFAVALAIALVFFFTLRFILRDSSRAGFLTAVIVMLFFSFGHVYDLISQRLSIPHHTLTGFYGAGILMGLFFTLKKPDLLRTLVPSLNLFGVLLVLFPTFQVATSYFAGSSLQEYELLSAPQKTKSIAVQSPSSRPDIYFIILDEYPRADVLQDIYDYDNSDFISFLKESGFYVAEKSMTNYPRTAFALASSLNMEYVNFLTEKVGPDQRSQGSLFSMIMNNKVGRFLKTHGYKYILIDSGAPPTQESPLADVLISSNKPDELYLTLFNATWLVTRTVATLSSSWRFRHSYNFQELAKIPSIKEPTFTFAHFLLPHPPFVFDRNGKPAEPYELRMTPDQAKYLPPDKKYKELYLDQLIYTTHLVKNVIAEILLRSKQPPIIILQSDHGSWPAKEWENSKDWLNERMPILNAYFLPGQAQHEIYPSITPVNTFRFIFKYYFNEDIDLLEDKIYYSHPYKSPFKFTEVTNILREIDK